MKITFAELHKALQFADEWYWDDIESVVSFFPASDWHGAREHGEIRLRPDAQYSEILFLHNSLCEQLEAFGADPEVVAHIRRNSRTDDTYWGPEITISDIDLIDIPNFDDDESDMEIPDPTAGLPIVTGTV